MIINYKWVFVKNQSEKRRPAESGGDNSSDLIWTQTDRRHDLVLLALAKIHFMTLLTFWYWQESRFVTYLLSATGNESIL